MFALPHYKKPGKSCIIPHATGRDLFWYEPVSEMTYTVSSGTLNSSIPYLNKVVNHRRTYNSRRELLFYCYTLLHSVQYCRNAITKTTQRAQISTKAGHLVYIQVQ